jgi:hypothetical protein
MTIQIPAGTVIRVKTASTQHTFLQQTSGIKTLRFNNITHGKHKLTLPSWTSLDHFLASFPLNTTVELSMSFPQQLEEFREDFTRALLRRNEGESWDSTYGSVLKKQRSIYYKVTEHYGIKLYEKYNNPWYSNCIGKIKVGTSKSDMSFLESNPGQYWIGPEPESLTIPEANY